MKKHCCHCGLEKQLKLFRARKLGVVGIIVMGAHILFHVVECLILPSLIVGFSGHMHELPVAAESSARQELDEEEDEPMITGSVLYSFEDTLQLGPGSSRIMFSETLLPAHSQP